MMIGHTFKAFDSEIVMCMISEKKNAVNILKQIEKNAVRFEERFSRFKLTSELSRINNRKNNVLKVSAEMFAILSKAKRANFATKGIFDPSIYKTLLDLGYDKSFSIIQEKGESKTPSVVSTHAHQKKFSFSKIILNKENRTIELPPDVQIDLGGIAKGYWVDSMRKILDQYSKNYWISAGGDIFLKGKNEDNKPWQVAVENPLDPSKDILTLRIPEQGYGIATSGVNKRKGQKNGKNWNHIIDPRHNTHVENAILSVTVIAKNTTDADIMAKTVLILGIEKGLALINKSQKYATIIIDHDLGIYTSRNIKKFL